MAGRPVLCMTILDVAWGQAACVSYTDSFRSQPFNILTPICGYISSWGYAIDDDGQGTFGY
jgi:hypothetical protein